MKHPYVPFIANQCKELYGVALKSLQKENMKQMLDKEWLNIVIFIHCCYCHRFKVF